MRINYKSDFHNRNTYIIGREIAGTDWYTVSARQMRAARRRVCGIGDCCCPCGPVAAHIHPTEDGGATILP